MEIKTRYTPPYADNLQIFVPQVRTAGLQHYKSALLKFAGCGNPYLEFEQEPQNPHDPNAIKVMGKAKGLFGTKAYFLGYVPAELAKQIIEGGYYNRVSPRIRYLRISAEGWLDLEFDLLGPKGEKKSFHGK